MASEHDTDQTDEAAKADDETSEVDTAEPVYNDRSKLDFDPDDGLYTGTAVTGDSDIPGGHEAEDADSEDADSEDADSEDADSEDADDSANDDDADDDA